MSDDGRLIFQMVIFFNAINARTTRHANSEADGQIYVEGWRGGVEEEATGVRLVRWIEHLSFHSQEKLICIGPFCQM